MSRITFAGVFTLGVALMGLSARAAAPELPPDAVTAQTIAVIRADSAHCNPDALKAAAYSILGANASKTDEALAKFKEKFDKVQETGVEAMTLVMTKPAEPKSAEPTAAAYLMLKDGSDPKAVEKMIREQMPENKKDDSAFEEQGKYLVIHQKNQPLPTGPDAAKSQVFADALGSISDAAIQIAFIPDADMKEKMSKSGAEGDAPPYAKDAVPIVVNAKWITLAVALGDTPGLTFGINAGDDASATKLADDITAGLEDLKKQAANGGGPGAMFGPLVPQIADAMKPTTRGGVVSAGLKGKPLTTIAMLVMQFTGMGAGGPGAGPASGAPAPAPQ